MALFPPASSIFLPFLETPPGSLPKPPKASWNNSHWSPGGLYSHSPLDLPGVGLYPAPKPAPPILGSVLTPGSKMCM